jgi:hypothetical protein
VAKTLGQRKFQVGFDLSEARRQVIANDRFNAPSFQRRGKAANAAAENGDAHASYVVSRTPPVPPVLAGLSTAIVGTLILDGE